MSDNQHTIATDAELLTSASGAVVAVDQIMKTFSSEEHKTQHAVKAAIGTAVAIGAFELLRREEEEGGRRRSSSVRRRSSSVGRRSSSVQRRGSSSRSRSPSPKHHFRHIAEEVLGAYGIGKEMMGDKRHHVAHLVEAVIGAVGLVHDAKAHSEVRDDEK
ncbi:hypothetical protein GLAREA_06144 [Glarea lozoyensis ATCC 20868]|uniref:Uncharacterized protein n=1 Tax=Glarea lozoyensis (strain ATCC 20868 / MF5171) TaxID=1116229 RepID=S3D3S7_GLAL2|nr:uncharacterized protein GLAREA_06144 [Glarea lozoyensis ATCC 20868]EPE33132.1 hypothetical protein GLAREA_06144 [Glarea lozoyensis ATCC 20868]